VTDWTPYINLPFKDLGRDFSGVDCYGLVALVYEFEKNVIIPDYTELLYNKDRHDIKEKKEHILETLGVYWLKVKDKLKPFDVLVFNKSCNSKIASHVGLCIGKGKFIHVLEDSPSRIERLDNPLWKTKFYGALRWQK
jgi:probable lipoprotein NlpC